MIVTSLALATCLTSANGMDTLENARWLVTLQLNGVRGANQRFAPRSSSPSAAPRGGRSSDIAELDSVGIERSRSKYWLAMWR